MFFFFFQLVTRNGIITPKCQCCCIPERDHLALTIGVRYEKLEAKN